MLILCALIVFVVGTVVYYYGEGLYLDQVTGDGDSIMATSVALQQLNRKLQRSEGKRWKVINLAKTGSRVGIELAEDLDDRFWRFRLPWKRRDRIWLIAGTNDFTLGRPDRVETLLNDLEAYFRFQNEQGYPAESCFYTDLLPRADVDDGREPDRLRFNSLVAERLKGLAIVIPSGSNQLLANPNDKNIYHDGVHLTPAGAEILAADAFAAMSIER